MTDIKVLWSKAAADAAGCNLSALQSQLLQETTEIVAKARGEFLHALRTRTDRKDCFTCTGNAEDAGWRIYVQLGKYRPLQPIRDDHPDIKMRGKIFYYPESVDDPDNEVFAPYEEIA